MHPKNTSSVHPTVHVSRVYFFMSCFPTMPLNRTKLKYGTMMLKAYETFKWMIELDVEYLLGLKSSLLVHPESVL